MLFWYDTSFRNGVDVDTLQNMLQNRDLNEISRVLIGKSDYIEYEFNNKNVDNKDENKIEIKLKQKAKDKIEVRLRKEKNEKTSI